VGHVTIIEGDSVRTGVTAVLPHNGNLFREKVAGAVYVFNAFGKLAGSTQVEELGQIETPIVLTNTLAVPEAAAAVRDWMLAQPGNENVRSINPLVGETNDGWLSDIRGAHVKAEHVKRAISSAADGAVQEGSVGAGTGTIAFGWKGGIGTSSRQVPMKPQGFTLGVLVQTNFGGTLTMDGVPVWKHLTPPRDRASGEGPRSDADGSCMMIVATDAPLDARQLKRLAARAVFGMARAGSSGSHGSGDYVIAFSISNRYSPDPARFPPSAGIHLIQGKVLEDDLSPLFQAAIEATEEAIYNSLLQATTVRGRDGRTIEAIPVDKLRELLKRRP
jgi:D-aminopeptidase